MTRYFFILLVLFSSCFWTDEEEDCEFVSCGNGPFYGTLYINVTINQENPEVFFEIFEGRIEEEILIDSFFTSKEFLCFELESGSYYSAKAYYVQGEKQIVAINGLTLKDATGECDCPEDGGSSTMDLELIH